MSRPTPAPKKKARPGLAIIASAILVPASALAAVAVVRPAPAEPSVAAVVTSAAPVVETTTTQITTTTEATAAGVSIVADPVSAGEDHLYEACMVDGPALVAAEAADEITPLQAAALDALRLVCSEENMPLPDPPAPPPVVRTVRVRSGSSSGSGSTSTPVTTVGVETEHEEEHEHEDEYEHEEEDEHEDEFEHEDGSGSADAQDAWVTARSNAVAAIAAANQVNPGSENLEEAEEKLGEADRAAAKGEWWEAVEKAAEATRKANKAANGG